MPTKSLAEIENDIAALQTQATKMRNDAKALAKPRLDEIKAQVEALITEAVDIIDANGIYDFNVVLKPDKGRTYYGADRLSYSYGQFKGDGPNWDVSAWEAS